MSSLPNHLEHHHDIRRAGRALHAERVDGAHACALSLYPTCTSTIHSALETLELRRSASVNLQRCSRGFVNISFRRYVGSGLRNPLIFRPVGILLIMYRPANPAAFALAPGLAWPLGVRLLRIFVSRRFVAVGSIFVAGSVSAIVAAGAIGTSCAA